MNEVSFADIVSKPVGVSYEHVQTLGIYCWTDSEKERNQRKRVSRMVR